VSLALLNKAIGLHTDGEEEGATAERCRRRMDRLVQDGDEQLNDIRTRSSSSVALAHIHLLEENIEKLVDLGWRDQPSRHDLWDIAPFDDDLAEAKVSRRSYFLVSARAMVVGP
jgi:hypothetical protein